MAEKPLLNAPAALAILERCRQTHPRAERVCVVTVHEPALVGSEVKVCVACAQAAYAAHQMATTAERRRP